MALWSHSQVQHRCLGRKLTFSKCLVKAWDSGRSSGGGLANLVGECVMATQSCPWQAKWPWAILIPSSLIFFFFFLSCEVCGDILILWIRKQSRWNHWFQTAQEALCHGWAGVRSPQGLSLCVPFPRSSGLLVPNSLTSDSDQVEYCIPDENTHFAGSQDMRKGAKKGVERIPW